MYQYSLSLSLTLPVVSSWNENLLIYNFIQMLYYISRGNKRGITLFRRLFLSLIFKFVCLMLIIFDLIKIKNVNAHTPDRRRRSRSRRDSQKWFFYFNFYASIFGDEKNWNLWTNSHAFTHIFIAIGFECKLLRSWNHLLIFSPSHSASRLCGKYEKIKFQRHYIEE